MNILKEYDPDAMRDRLNDALGTGEPLTRPELSEIRRMIERLAKPARTVYRVHVRYPGIRKVDTYQHSEVHNVTTYWSHETAAAYATGVRAMLHDIAVDGTVKIVKHHA